MVKNETLWELIATCQFEKAIAIPRAREPLPISESLLLLYSFERLSLIIEWQHLVQNLRQRTFPDPLQVFVFQALSCQKPRSIILNEHSLTQDLSDNNKFLYNLALIRLGDQFLKAAKPQLSAEHFSKLIPQSNVINALAQLKLQIIRLIVSPSESRDIYEKVEQLIHDNRHSALVMALSLAFSIYLCCSILQSLHYSHLTLQFQKVRLHLEETHFNQALDLVAQFLKDPEIGLSAALWHSLGEQIPIPIPTEHQRIPELYWFSHCLSELNSIQRASSASAYADLLALIYPQGNPRPAGLILACARSRLLALLIQRHPKTWSEGELQLWEKELCELGKMPYEELQSFRYLLLAAYAYKTGLAHHSYSYIKQASRLAQDKLRKQALKIWIAAARGKVRQERDPRVKIIAQEMLKNLFDPSLEICGSGIYRISGIYEVDLSKRPILDQLLTLVSLSETRSISYDQLRAKVWRESSPNENSIQSIHNSSARLRYFFRLLYLPVIVLESNKMQLNTQHFRLILAKKNKLEMKREQILKILSHRSLSLAEMAKELSESPSNVRRWAAALEKNSLITKTSGFPNIYQKLSNHHAS